MQRLLSATVWDEAGVRDNLRGYVLEHFADSGVVLVVDLCRSWNYAEAGAARRERAWQGGLLQAAGVAVIGIQAFSPSQACRQRTMKGGRPG